MVYSTLSITMEKTRSRGPALAGGTAIPSRSVPASR